MVYITDETITTIVTKTIKPSEVYFHDGFLERLNEYLAESGHKIVDFRPPEIGDQYITQNDQVMVNNSNDNFFTKRKLPRFIVRPLPPTNSDWWWE